MERLGKFLWVIDPCKSKVLTLSLHVEYLDFTKKIWVKLQDFANVFCHILPIFSSTVNRFLKTNSRIILKIVYLFNYTHVLIIYLNATRWIHSFCHLLYQTKRITFLLITFSKYMFIDFSLKKAYHQKLFQGSKGSFI